ncbi:MAG: MFS transporter [bacterium]
MKCPNCAKDFEDVPDEWIGKKVKCDHCGYMFFYEIVINQKTSAAKIDISLVTLYLIGIFIAVAESITHLMYSSIRMDLHVSETKMAIIYSILRTTPMIIAIPIGLLLDRNKRSHLIAIGIFLFSLSNILTSFSYSFPMLMILSVISGIGIGFILPGIISYIFDYANENHRGIALSLYLILSGLLAPASYLLLGVFYKSWKITFGIFGILGIVFSFLMYKLKEPKRNDNIIPLAIRNLALKDTNLFKALIRPSVLIFIFAGIFYSFGNYHEWLFHYFERYKEFERNELFTPSMIGLVIMMLSLFLSGYISDLYMKYNYLVNYYLIIAGIIGCFIFLPILIYTNSKLGINIVYCIMVLLFGLARIPFMVQLLSLIKSKYRMTIYGIDTFAVWIFGSSISKIATGALFDKFNLQIAMIVLSIIFLISAIGYALSGFYLSKELKRI